MVKKISICVFAAFFASFFSACSCNLFSGCPGVTEPRDEPLNLVTLDHNVWTQVTEGFAFEWNEVDGFFPNEKHIYGFDRHTMPKIDNGEDSIVYVSVLKGDSGVVSLKINQDFGSSLKLYDYYICEPTQLDRSIGYIDTSKTKLQYAFTPKDSVEIIALCKKSEVGSQKVQELHINSYDWNSYDFYVYILGDKNNTSDRHQLLNSTNFWNLYDSVYSQAIVKHDRLLGEFKTVDRSYVLTKVHGTFNSCLSAIDFYNDLDIYGAIRAIQSNVSNKGLKRNILQVGYPTKRVWILKYDTYGYVQICGDFDSSRDPTLNPDNFNLELEMLPSSKEKKCSKIEASVIRDKNRGVWKLRYKNGTEADATIDNLNKSCVVFADVNLGDYVGEVNMYSEKGSNVFARTYFHPIPVMSLVVQPWLGTTTSKTALHELGHTMGLSDVDSKTQPAFIEYNNEENNLMMQNGAAKSLHLRKRPLKTIHNGLEYQWGCLHKESRACQYPYSFD